MVFGSYLSDLRDSVVHSVFVPPVFVSDPLVRNLRFLAGADDGDRLSINECLIVAGNEYPTGMQSTTATNLVAYLLK